MDDVKLKTELVLARSMHVQYFCILGASVSSGFCPLQWPVAIDDFAALLTVTRLCRTHAWTQWPSAQLAAGLSPALWMKKALQMGPIPIHII